MSEVRIREPEVIEALLGNADPVLDAHVREAIRSDPRVSAIYAEWAPVIPALEWAASPVREMNGRVGRRVMDRLGRENAAEGVGWRIPDEKRKWGRWGLLVLAIVMVVVMLGAAFVLWMGWT